MTYPTGVWTTTVTPTFYSFGWTDLSELERRVRACEAKVAELEKLFKEHTHTVVGSTISPEFL